MRVYIYLILAALTLCVGKSSAQNTATRDPSVPVTAAGDQGYFPTLKEAALLRGAENSRSNGGFMPFGEGPDNAALVATDMFPYEGAEPNFYQRNPSFFKPLDHVLGLGTQFDAITYELDSLDNTSLTMDVTTGILNRQFSPELAMLKAGPLYLDVLWVGTGITWSDFNGPQSTITAIGERNSGDGATAFVDIGLRGQIRFTDSIYLSVVGSLMYLPFENRVALNFGNGRSLGLSTRINYSETFGEWDILLHSEFRGMPGINWFGQIARDGTDRAGRYFYGLQGQGRANQFYEQNSVAFMNTLGFNATRLVFDNQWRFGAVIDHIDSWQTFSFRNHRKQDRAGVWLGYEGSVIPFSPRFSYDITSYDGYNSLRHTFNLNLNGRLTENVSWASNVGTMFSTGTTAGYSQPLVWDINIDQVLTNNLSHWVLFGENIYDSTITASSQLSRFISYGIDQRIGSRFQATAFAQYSDNETDVPGNGNRRSRNNFGLTMNYHPLDFTRISASMLYQVTEQSGQASDSESWIYRLDMSQQLGLRLNAMLYYQFQEQKVDRFTEHAIGLELRRYF